MGWAWLVWVRLGEAEICWYLFGWTGPGSAGLGLSGLGAAGFGWTRLEWARLGSAELVWARLGRVWWLCSDELGLAGLGSVEKYIRGDL